MKELFKKVFSKKIVMPVAIGLAVFCIFTFVVFPGLTTADTVVNIISTLIGVFTLITLFYYIDADKLYKPKQLTDQEIKEKLESELGPVIDNMAKEVLKKKPNPKQMDQVKSEEPFVKTRKKSKNKKTK